MEKKAWQYSKLDKHVSQRFKKLGDLGEFLAEQLLKENGFTNVRNLNIEKNKNVKDFDIYAERKKQKYVISVKTRNKYENSKAGPRLNSRYKLCDDPNEFENEARKKYNSNSAWVTISVEIDKGIFEAYFGTLDMIEGNRKGIVMSDIAKEKYEKLAYLRRFEEYSILKEEYLPLKNVYKKIKANNTILTSSEIV